MPMPIPDYNTLGMHCGCQQDMPHEMHHMMHDMHHGMMGYGMTPGTTLGAQMPMQECTINLCPTTASFTPRAYIIDQPYMGLLPLSEGLIKGTVFPNIILPPIV